MFGEVLVGDRSPKSNDINSWWLGQSAESDMEIGSELMSLW